MTKEEIKKWRDGMALTQKDAARLLGVGLRTYERLERGGEIDRRTELAIKAITAGIA